MSVITECAYCGGTLSIKKCKYTRTTHHFCNRDHYGKWRSQHQIGENNPNYKEKIKRVCKNCNVQYESFPSNVRNKQGFCSLKCYHEWRRKQAKLCVIKCVVCGKEKQSKPSRLKRGIDKCCSKRCESILKSQTRLRENNPNWKNGASQETYCPKFNRPFREGVREFWGHMCGLCEKRQEDNIIIRRGEPLVAKLSVHHVNYNKSACCDGQETHWMFAPVCHECHGKTNGKRDDWKKILSDKIIKEYQGKSYLTETEYKQYFAKKKLNPEYTIFDLLTTQ
jgi:hypothetical protein